MHEEISSPYIIHDHLYPEENAIHTRVCNEIFCLNETNA